MTQRAIPLAILGCLCTLTVAADAPATQSQSFKPDAEGFIRDWLVLEPLRINPPQLNEAGVQAVVKQERFKDQFTLLPRAGDNVDPFVTAGQTEVVNGQWHAVHAPTFVVNLAGFAAGFGKPTTNVLFWGVTYVNCPEEMKDVRLSIGSNDSSVWWVNGTEVIGGYGDRQTQIDDNVSKRLTLNKGTNVVRFAVVNGAAGSDCCARFFDRNIKPITTITVSVDPPPVATTQPR